MTVSDELSKLHDLHQRGGLSDEEFARAKARLIDNPPGETAGKAIAAANAWRRSRQDAWFGGVCGGIARATGLESWLVRLLFCLLLL
ncbi:MAG: PspC domain-containing protein, partial [Proteobacteria bacterium]|nr:PspC domain-containing protein [Pseudomonadota bacterium]